jgi:N-terminal domain of galactosyltransferase/N-terminal region of glycosyl transferase group 7
MTIIVPYRDRPEHLAQFIPHMRAFLPDAKIVVVEQADDKPFNRAKLLNIGVLECPDDAYAFHDVDKLPVKANYSYPQWPRQIAPNPFQTQSYFGGVTLFNHNDFYQVNGFSNHFWGWGGEDNELMFQVHRCRMRATWDIGEFIDLPHPRPGQEFEYAKWEQAKRLRRSDDGILNCKYDFFHGQSRSCTHLMARL